MFAEKVFILFLSSIFVIGESAFVDSLGKCSIHDDKCIQKLIQKSILAISNTGISELNIPPIDPIKLTNISVSVLNVLDITLVDGVAKGIKDCIVAKASVNIEKELASLELLCDITVKGEYTVFSSSPIIKDLLGGETIHGNGVGKVKMESLRMKLQYNFRPKKRADDIYLQCKFNKTQYEYDIGKMTFAADNLYLGKTESSKMIVNVLNENWKALFSVFGNSFMDKAIEIMYGYTHSFFDKVPAKYYIIEDLSQYLKP